MTRNLCIGLLVLAAGCVAADIGEGDEAGLEEIEFAADNGIFLDNGLNLANGMNLGNGTVLRNGMNLGNGIDIANGMNLGNGIYAPPSGSGLEQWIDVDPPMRKKILRYLVECALPPGVPVALTYRGNVETLGYGVAGLGPSLQRGTMEVIDQERVTACMLARINGTGRTVQIDMFGPMGADSGFETASAADDAFPVLEAAFYGNLFATSPRAHACQQEQYALTEMRSCRDAGGGVADCGVVEFAYGTCGAYLGDYAQCGTWFTGGSAPRDYYQQCIGGGRTWEYVLTTYLQPSAAGEPCFTSETCASGVCDGSVCQ